MNLCINARRFYPELQIPINYNQEEVFAKIPGLNERLRIVLVQKGTGIVQINEKRVAAISPAVFCINEKEEVYLENYADWVAASFYFHPQYINSYLSFDKIRGTEEDQLITEKQDIFLFKPFIERNETYAGLLNLDILTMNALTKLLESIKHEISEQSHRFWSCCARSFFLELLFTIFTVYQSPESKITNIIKNKSNLTDKVILYLNTNYHKKITITELSKYFNINRTTLQKQFHEATGQSVLSYLIALRIKLAALMLKDTGLKISDIVERLGFSDSTHFNKMFHRQMGYSPTQYRQQFTWVKQ